MKEDLNVSREFARRVAEAPNHPAIEMGTVTLSYRDLSDAIEGVQAWLPEDSARRAISVRGASNPGTIVSMMAAMASRAVALPLDHLLPRLRKERMETLGRAFVVLDAIGGNPERPDELHIAVDPNTGHARSRRGTVDPSLWRALWPDGDPAYLFFTSGSTGVPKGILGRAESLAQFVEWQRRTFQISAASRVAQLTRLSFDPVLREIFVTLTSGATLVQPANDRARLDPIAWLIENRVAVLHAVPGLTRQWLRSKARFGAIIPDLRLIFFAGEPLDPALVRQWRTHAPNAEIINLYGPTETTLARFFWRVPVELNDTRGGEVLPVGYPIPDASATLESMSNEGVGEVVIDTAFGTYGYLPGTATLADQARFLRVADPSNPGANRFRTGDLGRFGEAGELYILGRTDRQMKLKGVRFQPSEIEIVLRQCGGIVDAAIKVVETAGGEPFIVAWCISDNGPPETSQIRKMASKHLPTALIPVQFVHVREFPRTTSGKVDYAKLELPEELEDPTVTARDDADATEMVEIWRKALDTSALGPHSDFFRSGGDSLNFLALQSNIAQRFDLELDLDVLVENPTPAALARWCSVTPKPLMSTLPRSDSGSGVIPFSAEQRAYIAAVGPNLAGSWCTLSRIFVMRADITTEQLRDVVNALIRTHDVLNVTLVKDGQVRQPADDRPADEAWLSVLDTSERDALSQARSIVASRRLTLDPSSWPLFRITLVRAPARCSAVVVWMHHMIIDGPSFDMLVDEIKARLVDDGPAAAFGYLQYINEQLSRASPFSAKNDKFPAIPRLRLAERGHDAERRTDNPDRGRMYVAAISPELTESLRNWATEWGCTAFVIALGGTLRFLCRQLDRPDATVIVPYQTTARARHPGTLGLFTNYAPATMSLTGLFGPARLWSRELMRRLGRGTSAGAVGLEALYGSTWSPGDAAFPISTILFNSFGSDPSLEARVRDNTVHWPAGRDFRFQLQITLKTSDRRLFVEMGYRSSVYTEVEIERLAAGLLDEMSSICRA